MNPITTRLAKVDRIKATLERLADELEDAVEADDWGRIQRIEAQTERYEHKLDLAQSGTEDA